jgi:Phage protein
MDRSTETLYGTGVGVEKLVAFTGCHPSTARRWLRLRRLPRWLQQLVAIIGFGELGPLSKDWDGWRVRGKHLISPEGWVFTFGEVRSIPFLQAQVRTWRDQAHALRAAEHRALEFQGDWIERRYIDPLDADADQAA